MKKAVSITTKILVWISFGLYLLALYYLLFIAYGRENWGGMSRLDYAVKHIKLVPFETIGAYVRAIKYGYMNSSIPATNLLGNFVLLIPFGIYLPLFIKKMKKWRSYVGIILLIIFLLRLHSSCLCGEFSILMILCLILQEQCLVF